MTHTAGRPAVSVHVYPPGLTERNTYRFDGRTLVHSGTEQAGDR